MGEQKRYKIALAGNPNVGKSTLFNALTGGRQHTGNWTGKTVEVATGICRRGEREYALVDLPGTYSLMAHSAEEEVARDYLLFERTDAVVVVCDAVCLARNMNLLLQVLEITSRVVLCVNLLDEAKKKHIEIDLPMLSRRLGIEVVGVVAKKRQTLEALLLAIDRTATAAQTPPLRISYPKLIEEEIARVEEHLKNAPVGTIPLRYLALHTVVGDAPYLLPENEALEGWNGVCEEAEAAKERLSVLGYTEEELCRAIVGSISERAEALLCHVVRAGENTDSTDRKIDRLLTGKWTAFPVMLLFLAFIFWVTVFGANYLSEGLFAVFAFLENKFSALLLWLGTPAFLHGMLTTGVFRVTGWVVSVMLPPMAIFFPLFTLLEDAGVLPRIAYNLDRPFCKSCSSGKQALTMCMGFGCNAVGVSAARIIDSKRERLLAIVTNSFMPCNGRLPTVIALLSIFVVGIDGGFGASVLTAILLLCVIILGVLLTFICNYALSKTIFKGAPSSYTLELPPYRRPDFLRVLARSMLDRTLHVLGRAVVVAAPFGALLYLLANVTAGGGSLLFHLCDFLDPIGRFLGLDGVILAAFLLGLPAGEIVLPIMLMAYLSGGAITEGASYAEIREILVQNGWGIATAVSVLLFTVFHFPCSTTLLTIYRETKSPRITCLSFALPTVLGILMCLLVRLVA